MKPLHLRDDHEGLSSSVFTEMIQVVVGPSPNEVRYFLHPAILSANSGYFKGASSDAWIGPGKTVTLIEEDPTIFAIFVTWLQTGYIESANEFIKHGDENHDDNSPNGDRCEPPAHTKQFEQLVSCYLFGDFLQAPEFQNEVVDKMLWNARSQRMFSWFVAGCTRAVVTKVYDRTRENDLLRRVINAILINDPDLPVSIECTLNKMAEGESNKLMLWHNDVLKQILTSVSYGKNSGFSPWDQGVCENFHQHPNEPQIDKNGKAFDCKSFEQAGNRYDIGY